MARPKVLVVYKKVAYQQYVQEQQDPHLLRLLRRGHPDAREMQAAHAVHEATMHAVLYTLRRLPVTFELAYRADLKAPKGYDLVVSVGGDGTFLQAARSIAATPILGVNADPARSEAVFCGANRRTFPRMLKAALSGSLPELRLHRLQISLNGAMLPARALNDVLVAHDDPATMSRYRLKIGGREEFQKSSGLWVATAAGSSSAVLAAGGAQLPWGAKKFQYKPREIYRGRLSRCRLMGGVLSPHIRLGVTWLMRKGSLFVDGPHVRIPLRFADRVEIGLSPATPLRVLGLSRPLRQQKRPSRP